ncbi:helix-turn-helix domain-containing protein [Sulfitobacter aestuariivivens]|uniref:Helix-turn-helix domain-containing protein n=1 Tax=Sulfitobacter aestuariivivens TaxID=2766981 RepID=A0A927D2B5_9RHOB|nr:helix-turn-helix domain-containing protein [Sulfitobacter aestuariivivens]MBD3663043.1 helix-turn-helix domain-containing protein [Sulfitobacter aestuariivivens]
MIGRWSSKSADTEVVAEEPKGFDAFELRLGDVMRGERATLGKSLLDVQRELRIKASYIAAIENANPDAFDTPGFIAGYVRSYARYLGMDPDKAFAAFCTESGFEVAHGMSANASVIKKPSFEDRAKTRSQDADFFAKPMLPFTPQGDSLISRIEPAAVGSMMVLVGLIGAIGFGGWTVLQEVQRVQVAPVDETPVVLSDLDPLDGALASAPEATSDSAAPRLVADAPRADALDRLYRPQALDVPRLTPRDAPIASIDPRSIGNFQSPEPGGLRGAEVQTALLGADLPAPDTAASVPQVVEGVPDTLRMVAVEPSWVQVKAADGSVIFETTMSTGDTWDIPATEEPPMLRTGQSGAIYFAMDNAYYGPVGPRGAVTSNVPLNREALAELYDPAVVEENTRLATLVSELQNAADTDEGADD